MKKKLIFLCILIFIVYILFFPQDAVTAAADGLVLWYERVLPSLLPFAILSNILIYSGFTGYLVKLLYPLLRLILPASRNGSFVLLSGFLFGFPMGSKNCAEMLKCGQLEYQEAEILFMVTNNISPVFISSYILCQELHMPSLMGRVLKYLSDRMELAVVSLAGGLKDNAIPRECETEIVIPEEKKAELSDYITELEKIFKKEYAVSDPAVCIEIKENGTGEYDVLSYSSMTKVIFYLRNVPNGVQHMSMVMPGLVETSLNTGIMKLTTDGLELTASVRSSVSTRKEELKDKLEYLAEFLGGEISVSGDYPAWEYRAKSDIREGISVVYEELFHEEPVFEAIHAGLECGILSGKIADLDCVSFGPNNFDIHTPKERLSISSTEKVWKLIVEFLKRSK